jgi:ParB family chromosome partitioning protein
MISPRPLSQIKASETTNDSERQVQRYIRLTYLNKPLLDMVDKGRIAFTPAVELSYLNEIEQQDLVEAIAVCECPRICRRRVA